jgi:phosphoglycolate phosphatase-like HAD superfamily hydrolase
MSKGKKTIHQLNKKIKYVGFDKDGTLINSLSAYTKKWGEIINSKYGINKLDAEKVFRQTAGLPTDKQLSMVLKTKNASLSQEELFRESNFIAEELSKRSMVKLFPEVRKVLSQLKKIGYLIFISSGNQEKVVEEDLRRTKLMQFVDYYFGIRPNQPEFKKGKPHFKEAAKYFGTPFDIFTTQTVFIGDSLEDIRISNEAKIISIGRSGSYSKKDLLKVGAKIVVPNLSKLSTILSNL